MKHRWGLRSGNGNYEGSNFDPETEVYGKGNIIKSNIKGNAKIISSNIISSEVVHYAVVANSKIVRSLIQEFAVVEGSSIWKSQVKGHARVMDKAFLFHSGVEDFAQVCGNARLEGFVLGGFSYVHKGIWTRPPLTYVCEKSGFVVTECTEGHIDIGCICNTPQKFLKAGERYNNGYLTEEQIDEIREIVKRFI